MVCISTRFVILAPFMDNKFAKAQKMHKGWFEKVWEGYTLKQ